MTPMSPKKLPTKIHNQLFIVGPSKFTRTIGDNRDIYIKYSLKSSLFDRIYHEKPMTVLDIVRSNHPGVMRAALSG